MIDGPFRARAEAALDAVERDENVQVLLAVESGSRAWGFPSRDSDYDVRFIFLRPLADYLRITPLPDVIERPVEAELDLGGWDLRKALALAVRSNAVVLEWLASPVVYRSRPREVARLAELAAATAHPPALTYHYDRLARGTWNAGQGDVRLKSYLYAVRSALALAWLRRQGTAPPMHLAGLLAGVTIPPEAREAIDALVSWKSRGNEAATVARDPLLEAMLAEALAVPAPRPVEWNQAQGRIAADALFLKATTSWFR